MGQLLLLPSRPAVPVGQSSAAHCRSAADPAAAARGILLALALSTVGWVGIALIVPLLW